MEELELHWELQSSVLFWIELPLNSTLKTRLIFKWIELIEFLVMRKLFDDAKFCSFSRTTIYSFWHRFHFLIWLRILMVLEMSILTFIDCAILSTSFIWLLTAFIDIFFKRFITALSLWSSYLYGITGISQLESVNGWLWVTSVSHSVQWFEMIFHLSAMIVFF